MNEIQPGDYAELKATMNSLTAAVTELTKQVAVHNAVQTTFEQKVTEKLFEHERILYGDREKSGLLARTDKLEAGMQNINKVAWAFFAPAIAIVFFGLLASIWVALTMKGGTP